MAGEATLILLWLTWGILLGVGGVAFSKFLKKQKKEWDDCEDFLKKGLGDKKYLEYVKMRGDYQG